MVFYVGNSDYTYSLRVVYTYSMHYDLDTKSCIKHK